MEYNNKCPYICTRKIIYIIVIAGVAQLVERQPSKLNVASSNLVSRSTNKKPDNNILLLGFLFIISNFIFTTLYAS